MVRTVRAEIGRVDDNGLKSALLSRGATVEDLLEQAGFSFDEDKEKIIAESTGEEVDLEDEVEHGETYIISSEIKSA